MRHVSPALFKHFLNESGVHVCQAEAKQNFCSLMTTPDAKWICVIAGIIIT